MNAEQAVRTAIGQALRDDAALSMGVNGVRFGASGRVTTPHVSIGDMIAVDWGTKSAAGREVRCAVTIRDMGETPARLESLMALAEAAIDAMPRDLPGWQVASLVFLRSRIGRDGPSGWIGVVDYRVRVLEV